MNDTDRILIAGAGPVGQVCAGLLHLQGIPVTILGPRCDRLPNAGDGFIAAAFTGRDVIA